MNTFLTLYIGSTAYVWLSTYKHFHDLDKRLKREGYKFTGKKYFSLGDIVVGGIYLVILSIPALNLLVPVALADKDRSYDEYKNYLLEAGAIDEPDPIPEHEDGTVFDNDEEMIMVYEKYFKPKNTNYYEPQNIDTNIDENDKGYSYKKTLK